MKFNIVCVGNLKEKYWENACQEYIKRLCKFHTVEVIEVEEERLPKNFTIADITKVQVKESMRLEKHLKGYVVVLDRGGRQFTSEEFAGEISKLSHETYTVTFVIGGSFGISNLLKEKTNAMLSFGKVTYPHQLMRVILLEQLYRITAINNNIPYHK